MDALGVAAREVVEVVVHARHDDRDVARAREVAEHLGGAAVAGGVEEQEVAVGVVELEQPAQARVGLRHARRAQPLDLVLDRLRVGGVAQADRRAVEVADELGPLAGERLGDRGVERGEEPRDRGRVGIAREQRLELRGGALDRLAVGARGRRAGAAAARDQADRPRRLARDLARGPGDDQRGDDRRDHQQHAGVLGRDLPALPSQHDRQRRARRRGAREARDSTSAPGGSQTRRGPGSAMCPYARASLKPRPREADDSRMSQRGEDDRRAIAASAAAIYVGAACIGLVEGALPGGEPFSLVPAASALVLSVAHRPLQPAPPARRARRARPARRRADRRGDVHHPRLHRRGRALHVARGLDGVLLRHVGDRRDRRLDRRRARRRAVRAARRR